MCAKTGASARVDLGEKTYKRSLRQKMKRTAMDNNYMIQVLSCCFIGNTLDSSESFCQA